MSRPPTDSVRMNFFVPTKLATALRKLANYRGISVSELVRAALKDYILREVEREKSARS